MAIPITKSQDTYLNPITKQYVHFSDVTQKAIADNNASNLPRSNPDWFREQHMLTPETKPVFSPEAIETFKRASEEMNRCFKNMTEAFHKVQIPEALTKPYIKPAHQRPVICAASIMIAKEYARVMGLDNPDWVYASHPDFFMGKRELTVYCVGDYQKNPAWHAIEYNLRLGMYHKVLYIKDWP